MANERVNARDSVGLKLIGPDGAVKSNTTGIVSDMEARKRLLLALVSKLLRTSEKSTVEKEKTHV